MRAVGWDGLEQPVERLHEISQDGHHGGIEKVGGEVVDAKLEGAETLADLLRAALKGENKRLHEIAQIREQVGEADGDGECELDKHVAFLIARSVFEQVGESVEHLLQDRQDLLVQCLEATSADGSDLSIR